MRPALLALACVADVVLGDPRWMPHPVRLMGAIIGWAERAVRRLAQGARAQYAAGVLLALLLPAAAGAATWAVLQAAAAAHPRLHDLAWVVLAWTTLAARDLADHALAVARALEGGALEEARRAAGLVVGRDTAALCEAEVVRATTESVAEGTADGIVAPLFFLALGGPSLAMAFKTVSTLDSMIGHRSDRYRCLGWASARLDDALNWIPARISGWLLVLSAGILQRRRRAVQDAAAILRRDRRRHPSPNSGWPEAAMAGALGVRLGGTNVYEGRAESRPYLGDPGGPLRAAVIRDAVRHMWATAALAAALALGGTACSWSGW